MGTYTLIYVFMFVITPADEYTVGQSHSKIPRSTMNMTSKPGLSLRGWAVRCAKWKLKMAAPVAHAF